jgi:hypothetical protein
MGERMNATEYAQKGWFVLPLKKQSKEPARFLRHGYLDATIDQEKIDQWFADQELNIGLGISQSSLVVLDFDVRNSCNDPKWLELLDRCFKCNTHVVATHDGYHIYFYVEKPMQFKGKLISGIDIKHKGYVVLPPSIHPSGTLYKIVNDVAPVDLPEDLMKLMTW